MPKYVACGRHLAFRARLPRPGECGGRTHVAYRTIESQADTRHATSAVAAAYRKRPPILWPNTSTAADISHSAHDKRAPVGVAAAHANRTGPVGTHPNTRRPTLSMAAAYRKRPLKMCLNMSTAADSSHSVNDRRAPVAVAAARACATGPVRHRASTRHPTLAMAAAYRERPPNMCPNSSTAADISHSAHDKRASVAVAAAQTWPIRQ